LGLCGLSSLTCVGFGLSSICGLSRLCCGLCGLGLTTGSLSSHLTFGVLNFSEQFGPNLGPKLSSSSSNVIVGFLKVFGLSSAGLTFGWNAITCKYAFGL
jgi:hypothetical protein